MNFKNRLFLSFLLIAFSGQINGMDYRQIAARRIQANEAAIEKKPVLALSFYYCQGCGKAESNLFCAGCKGVNYCSKACQNNCWHHHRQHCKKIARVERGDLKWLQSFYQVWLDVAKETKDLRHIRQAHNWALRFALRFQQDRYCTQNHKAFSKYFDYINTGEFREIANLFTEQLDSQTVDDEVRYASVEALNWAKDLTNSGTMICPGGILDYSEMPGIELYSADKWLNWRALVLKVLIEKEEDKQKKLLEKLKNEN